MRFIRKLAAVILVTCLSSCIPITTAKIELGSGYEVRAMDRVDGILEKIGFTRIYYEPSANKRLARFERDGEMLSGFEAPGFGASVSWRTSGGRLEVIFAERNTSFSAHGKDLLQNLVGELRREFGDRIAVVQ